MPKAKPKVVGIRWISKQQLRKALDARARRVLGCSGASFQKKYSSGELRRKSLEGKVGTVELATLCSFARGRHAKSNRKRSR